MTDVTTFRRFALALPAAEEHLHRGHPAFSVREKIFATLWPEEKRAVLKLSLDDQSDLVAARPAAFSLNAWSKQGWTNLHLEHVTPAECRELLLQAWRGVSPKKLVRAYDEQEAGALNTSRTRRVRDDG